MNHLLRLKTLRDILASSAFTFACLAGISNAQVVTVGRPSSSQAISMDRIDHTSFDKLLQKYVDVRGDVNYKAWRSDTASMTALDDYLNHLASASVSAPASRESKLSFWINAYNAVTLRGILREYPTTSIKNHVSNLGGYNIWKHFKLVVDGKPYSLDDMEHAVLRKMDEPRIHFAVVCASKSCPRLLNRAFTAATLEKQLAENARYFFSLPTNFRYDATKNRVYLSSILKWYGTDFAATPTKQLQRLAQYLPAGAQSAIAQGRFKVTYQKYDWGINEQVAKTSD